VTIDFPAWLRAAHWINVFFLGFLIRAGIQILGAYPRLYWNDHSTPGTEWLKFAKRPIPTDRPWTALEQERDVSAWLGQPGGNNLGWLRRIEFVADYRDLGAGQGGSREDTMFYEQAVGI
jgi:hypothetical protein